VSGSRAGEGTVHERWAFNHEGWRISALRPGEDCRDWLRYLNGA
jgi:hypothetical protein